MAAKRVIAYYMHEGELALVHSHLTPAAVTGAYVVGSVEEERIADLESEGIVVEVMEEPPPRPELPPVARRGALSGAMLGPAALPGEPLEPTFHPTKNNVFVVSLDGPVLLEDWRQQVEALGVTFIEHRSDGSYTARMSLAQVATLRQLPFVRDVRLLAPVESTGAVFSTAADAAAKRIGIAPTEVTYDVLLHDPDDLDDVLRWLDEQGVAIVASGRRKVRIRLDPRSPRLRRVQALPGVAEIQEFVPPRLANQRACQLIGLAGNPAPPLAQTGSGEIIAVADSGLDAQHPAFAGRIHDLVPRARPGDASDPHGHGTHVAGSALGGGLDGGAVGRGVAPGASLFFQSIMDEAGRLSGLPLELSELFDEAYQRGARIHNNSWSADTSSFYTFNSREVDEFVEQHPDMLVVVAAGNRGSAESPFNAQTGFVDWQSIGSPATAKNALTVGASRSDRTDGGLSQRDWRSFDPLHYADPPIADERVSGDPESLAAFSSRGPCDSNRIKPDVVAPGTDILSARAANAPAGNFWGQPQDPALDGYAFMGGTSMAAPLVAGCAALVRQYYRQQAGIEPSAALLKATLVNSTRWLSGSDATADGQARCPNYHQGFGAIFMPFAVPNPAEPWLRLHVVDTWKDPAQTLTVTGDRRRYAFTVERGAFLRVTLAWTDPAPGPGIQNVLAFFLETPAGPQKIAGNHERPRKIDPVDRDNNVQIVRLDDPPPGDYLISVFSRNMLRPPQDFALVVTGGIADAGLIPI